MRYCSVMGEELHCVWVEERLHVDQPALSKATKGLDNLVLAFSREPPTARLPSANWSS